MTHIMTHFKELKRDSKSISAVPNRSLKVKHVVEAVLTCLGRHGLFVIRNVLVVYRPELDLIHALFQLNKTVEHVVELDITMPGLHGVTVLVQLATLSFVEVEQDVDHVKASVVQWTKYKKSNATCNVVVTTVPGLLGLLVVLLAALE